MKRKKVEDEEPQRKPGTDHNDGKPRKVNNQQPALKRRTVDNGVQGGTRRKSTTRRHNGKLRIVDKQQPQ